MTAPEPDRRPWRPIDEWLDAEQERESADLDRLHISTTSSVARPVPSRPRRATGRPGSQGMGA